MFHAYHTVTGFTEIRSFVFILQADEGIFSLYVQNVLYSGLALTCPYDLAERSAKNKSKTKKQEGKKQDQKKQLVPVLLYPNNAK